VAQPKSTGLSADRLGRIGTFLEDRYVGPGKLPCAQVQVWRRGGLAYETTLGLADRERGRSLSRDDIFRIYSMTKPVTSVALMMRVEEGLVALDDPVSRFIPSWKTLGVYAGGFMETFQTRAPGRPMMVVDLLRHTSGLTYGFQQQTNIDAAYRRLKLAEDLRTGTLAEMVETLATLPLQFSPGDDWNYSVSTDVVGHLVEVISGETLDAFFARRIFEPLGMIDTAFDVPAEKAHRLTACYAAGQLGSKLPLAATAQLQDDPVKSPYLKPATFLSGGGGLVSTADDYMKFARMLLNGGELDGVRILAPASVELMGTNFIPKSVLVTTNGTSGSRFNEAIGFGLDFMVNIDPRAAGSLEGKNTMSWGGAAGTWFWVDPTNDLYFIGMVQRLGGTGGEDLGTAARTLTYQALVDPAK
jgi:CubicO group peptidase (beta-lactamase class C family)